DIVRLLLDEGADIDAPGTTRYGTPLFEAAINGNIEIVRLLIDRGAHINAPGEEYYGTALHGAALNGHEAILELLLDEGADVHIDCGTFGTPLQAAVSFNRKEV
ncbi:ankyrin, partial [Cadophora sp. DSE1049]